MKKIAATEVSKTSHMSIKVPVIGYQLVTDRGSWGLNVPDRCVLDIDAAVKRKFVLGMTKGCQKQADTDITKLRQRRSKR